MWRALDTRINQQVAVKFLRQEVYAPNSPEGRQVIADFEKELDALKSIQHGVVKLLDKGMLPGGRLFFVMEWLDGEGLDELLKRQKKLSGSEVLSMLQKVARTLHETHAKNIIHRDIKPSNIFIQRTAGGAEYRLIDFGVAKQMDGAATRTRFSGTYRYAAPEQISRKASPMSDLYSLGVVAWEALAGRPLFRGDDELAIIGEKARTDWVPPPWPNSTRASNDLKSLIGNLICLQPENRGVKDAADLLRRLANIRGQLSSTGPNTNFNVTTKSHSPIFNTKRAKIVAVFSMLSSILGLATTIGLWFPLLDVTFISIPAGARVYKNEFKLICETQADINCTGRCEGRCTGRASLSFSGVDYVFKHPDYPLPKTVSLQTTYHREAKAVFEETFSNRKGMSLIPAGTFMMGCQPGDSQCEEDEKPAHPVRLDAYYIDQTEVTVAAYRKCVQAKKCKAPDKGGVSNYDQRGRDNHPVNYVNWHDAKAYCAFVGKRLPTEAEWENAARAQDDDVYPWGGSSPNDKRARFDKGGNDGTFPVRSYAAGAHGLYDMAGNLWEWVEDCYDDKAYKRSDNTNKLITNPVNGRDVCPSGGRVLRSGSFLSRSQGLRASDRYRVEPQYQYRKFGFRCVTPAS